MRHYVRLKPKKILLGIICFAAICQFINIFASYFTGNSCMGLQYQQFLCQKFKEGEIVGNLCNQLCSRHIKLSSCLDTEGDVQVFYTWNRLLKVSKKQYLSFVNGGIIQENTMFFTPTEATSISEFYASIAMFFEAKLGPGVYDNLVMRALKMVDHNGDGSLTLAESKTLWSLLQNNEFLALTIFQKEDNIPQIRGICGNVYALEHPQSDYLYNKNSNGLFRKIFPHSYTWLFPRWEYRAKVVYSVIEMMYTIYEDAYAGTFFMCGWDEENIGYSAVHEVQVTDFSYVIPKYELGAIQRLKSCTVNSQCQYGKHCQTRCDTETKRCTGILEKSNFVHICAILKVYLMKNAPDAIRDRLQSLFNQCSKLGGSDYVNQALFINDIKTLLWPRIFHMGR